MPSRPVDPEVRPGTLKVFVGAATGVGTTYRMLDEGRRRAARGADVVVGVAACRGRPRTEAMLGGLEILGTARAAHEDRGRPEFDLDRALRRAPALILVDDLAHTNAPGHRNAHRRQDVEELLAASIDVATTVGVRHLESLGDVVEKITGVPPDETVPDAVVRRADRIEHAPRAHPVLLTVSALAGRVELRVVDRAPGSRPATGNASSSRPSGSGTPTTPRGSASASLSPGVSPRRCPAR
ncbi:hypothetical protein ACIQUL_05615 [Streptomyces sp. NPDC090303]|uniref:histidine kinase n=1 Tax=Streptomyces sp. NPDC090303 TaxID=3365960 RepID=UPI0038228AA9